MTEAQKLEIERILKNAGYAVAWGRGIVDNVVVSGICAIGRNELAGLGFLTWEQAEKVANAIA
jgi:hypothetical protein